MISRVRRSLPLSWDVTVVVALATLLVTILGPATAQAPDTPTGRSYQIVSGEMTYSVSWWQPVL